MDRECVLCQRDLKPDNPGMLCVTCAHKLKDVLADLPVTLDVEDVRKILHLENEETVRRKLRNGELPDCIPGQKKKLWLKDHMMAFLEGRPPPAASAEEIQAIILALKLGWPIDQMTLCGQDPGNLIAKLKEYGHLQDGNSQSQ